MGLPAALKETDQFWVRQSQKPVNPNDPSIKPQAYVLPNVGTFELVIRIGLKKLLSSLVGGS